ncbi:MAG: SMC-Scp complex subunit ScpB, partial [Candidatus Pacearchaeota archaeon]|nr:SMC-Scp complex subunit ScpB [Candidatus Pacearchaeota archaeon]
KEKYEKGESAIEIVEKNNLWKMDVRQEYVYLINKLATGSSEFTKAEQETLAIIAFKQPIKQSVIIKIRGNKAYDHIKKFSDLGLIKRRKEGHTNILSLSDEFYDYFGVDENSALKKVVDEMEGEE